MAEAEEKIRREAEVHAGVPQQETLLISASVPAAPVRGWESLKAALRQLVGSGRASTVPHIVPAA